jgi:hypothetical protein
MLYVTDADARPAGAAHPLGNLWDNGSDPVAALKHELEVRKLAIDRFGAHALASGQPLAELEKAFVPVYLHHRYQVEAAAKMLGGFEYTYAVKGDAQTPQSPIPIVRQQEALRALLETLKPEALVIPKRILRLLPPRVGTSASDRERFPSRTSPIFDPNTAIELAARLTLANLLQPERASRLAQIEESNWGLSQVLEETCEATLLSPLPDSPVRRAARRVVIGVLVDELIKLAGDTSASDDARAIARMRLSLLNQASLRIVRDAPELERVHSALLRNRVKRFLDRPAPAATSESSLELPPGSPIGQRRQ